MLKNMPIKISKSVNITIKISKKKLYIQKFLPTHVTVLFNLVTTRLNFVNTIA